MLQLVISQRPVLNVSMHLHSGRLFVATPEADDAGDASDASPEAALRSVSPSFVFLISDSVLAMAEAHAAGKCANALPEGA